MSGTRRGPYRLIRLLGRGSASEVWAAERDGRQIAVKFLRDVARQPQFLEALRRELRIGQLVSGLGGVVAVQRVEELDGGLCLESEWVRGPNLEQVLAGRLEAGRGPIPASVVVSWGVQILRTLDEVARRVAPKHPQSFLHRDIKPANLLLDPTGGVRITDFGIARAEAHLGFQTTATGIVKGSPRFMAPEVILDRGPDARADQFSVGAVLYELLSGRPLYAGRDLVAIITLATTGQPDGYLDHLDAPRGLVGAVRAMIARERTDRYPSAREAAVALAAQDVPGPAPGDIVAQLVAESAGPEHRGRAPSAETTMALPITDEVTEEDHAADEEDTLLSDGVVPDRSLPTLHPDEEDTAHFDDDATEVIAVQELLDRLRRT